MRKRRRRVRRYAYCQSCGAAPRVEENGKMCRHTVGFGYAEWFPPGHPFKPGPICAGSGKKIDVDLATPKEQGPTPRLKRP